LLIPRNNCFWEVFGDFHVFGSFLGNFWEVFGKNYGGIFETQIILTEVLPDEKKEL